MSATRSPSSKQVKSCLQSQEDENLGSNTGVVVSFPTESLESREDDENQSPSVVQRVGEMNKEFVVDVASSVVDSHGVVNRRNRDRHTFQIKQTSVSRSPNA